MHPVPATPIPARRGANKPAALRGHEKIILAYFIYLPCLGLVKRLGLGPLLILASIPVALWAIWHMQARSSWRYVESARDWWPLGLILIGYWTTGWFAAPPRETLDLYTPGGHSLGGSRASHL